MPAPVPTIDVVICAYTSDRWEQLLDAVASVERQSLSAGQIIVVIDHNDQLLARAYETLGSHLVIPNDQDQGLSGARNTGVAKATADVVAFLDDDAAAEPGWLAEMARHLADEGVGGVGGWVVPRWESGAAPAWFPAEFLWVVGCSYRGLPRDVREVRNPIGANMAFRVDALDAAGGFRSEVGRIGTLPVGCEETLLSIEVRRGGWRILHLPDAIVHHHVPAARGRFRYFASRCLHEGRSKAVVARLTGADEALESERTYATRTLPAGVARGLTGGRDGIARSGAIVAGLAITTFGYLQRRIRPAS